MSNRGTFGNGCRRPLRSDRRWSRHRHDLRMLDRHMNADATVRALKVATATGYFLRSARLSPLEGLKTPPTATSDRPSSQAFLADPLGLGPAAALRPSSDLPARTIAYRVLIPPGLSRSPNNSKSNRNLPGIVFEERIKNEVPIPLSRSPLNVPRSNVL